MSGSADDVAPSGQPSSDGRVHNNEEYPPQPMDMASMQNAIDGLMGTVANLKYNVRRQDSEIQRLREEVR